MGQKLETFTARTRYGVCRYHDSGGVYHVLTEDKIIMTKRVHLFENSFPGLSIFWIETDPVEEFDDVDFIEELDVIDDDTPSYHPPTGLKPSPIEADLIYVPTVQVTYGEVDETLSNQEDLYDEDDYDVEDADVELNAGSSYNLWNQPRVLYFAMAHVNIVEEVHRSKLGFALKLDAQSEWIDAKNRVWHDKEEETLGNIRQIYPLSDAEVLLSGIVSRSSKILAVFVVNFNPTYPTTLQSMLPWHALSWLGSFWRYPFQDTM